MINDFVGKINELFNIILEPIDNMFKETAIKKYKISLNIDQHGFFSKCYIFNGSYKEKGVVYTPEEISSFIVKNSITREDIVYNPYIKIADPACGCGNLIIPCFKYLKQVFSSNLSLINEKNNLHLTEGDLNRHIIDNNLYGFDIDRTALKILMIDLFNVSGYVNEKNFIHRDFLIDNIHNKFNVFIGNPPYVGHKSVDREYSKRLKEKYKDIYRDKGDVSYCFFQGALDNLENNGKLAFITSRYFMEAQSGEALRKILKNKAQMYKIVDFYGIRPFKGIGIDPVIIFLHNSINDKDMVEIIKPIKNNYGRKKGFCESVFLNKGFEFKSFSMATKCLENKGWILIDEEERSIVEKIKQKSSVILGDICNSYQGIITGCDKAFVIDGETLIKEHIEVDIIRPWIKSSYINKCFIQGEDKFIIYSNLIKNEEDYPNAINYIKRYREKLTNRRECKKGMRSWYELQWGRTPEIFENEKIIFPYKSSDNRFALDKGSYFSADVYALLLKEKCGFSYDFLLYILNSRLYEFYFKTFGKKLGENLFEYYPNNINKLCIPIIPDYNAKKDDMLLYNFFELSENEINIIENSLN
jgi:adenine-specific DNA-methyltransferase